MTRYEKMKPALDLLFSDLSLDEFVNVARGGLVYTSCDHCGIEKYCNHMMEMDIPNYEEKYPFGNGVRCEDVIRSYLQEELDE